MQTAGELKKKNIVNSIQSSYKKMYKKEELRILNDKVDYNQKDLKYLKTLRKIGKNYQEGTLEKLVDTWTKYIADKYKKVYELGHGNLSGFDSEFYRVLHAKSANQNLDKINKAIKEKNRNKKDQ